MTCLHLYSESVGVRNSLLSFLKSSFTVPSVLKHQLKLRNDAICDENQREIALLLKGVPATFYYFSHKD